MEQLRVTPERAVCKCCGGVSRLCGVVDFSRCGADLNTGRKVDPYMGVPVYYFRCADCGFVFTQLMDSWTAQDFARYVYNDDYPRHDPDYSGKRPADNAALIHGNFPEIGHSRMLDFGSGLGLLEKELAQRGFANVHSFDPYAGNAASRERLAPPYNTIVAFEVFEHHPQPQLLMADVLSFLAEDGVILFSTLLIDDKTVAAGIENWWYCAPRNGHISFFSAGALAALARRHGLTVGSFNDGLHFFYRNGKDKPAWVARYGHTMRHPAEAAAGA